MERTNLQYEKFKIKVRDAREGLFRGFVWNDLGLIDQSLRTLQQSFGHDKNHVGKIIFDLLDEMEEEYSWTPTYLPLILREA